MAEKYYLNDRGDVEYIQGNDKNTGSIVLGALAVVFAIAFLIMLILFLFYETEDFVVPTLFLYDGSGDWESSEDISVFYNEDFGSTVVAPYSSGTYTFKFENQSDYTLNYSIKLSEENDYDLAFCYKLKRDGSYLQSDYVRTDDFGCEGLTIEADSAHSFELEWFWDGGVSDENDTLAGTSESIYTLTITFSAVVE